MVTVEPDVHLRNPLDDLIKWWEDSRKSGSEFDAGIEIELLKHGEGMLDSWMNLTFQEPPEGVFEKIFWYLGVVSQLFISGLTFPFAIAGFIMEETAQGAGMGAYMLASGKLWVELDNYLPIYKDMLDKAVLATKTIGVINPTVGGASLMYLQAAKASYYTFEILAKENLIKLAQTDKNVRDKLLEENKYGSLRIHSGPKEAEIWIDGANTELLTPETIKLIEQGIHEVEVRKYNSTTEEWDMFILEVEITAGIHKEIFINISRGISTDGEEPEAEQEGEEPILPTMIMAEVRGDHAIDGDTFATETGEIIRVLPIDTPEIGRPWADVATESLARMIEDKNIQLRIQSHRPIDTYGRTLAICRYYDGDIGTFQLSSGLAKVSIHQDDVYDGTKYYAAEQVAKDRKIGIWS